jgi:probable HAF family extracellular repeat protein
MNIFYLPAAVGATAVITAIIAPLLQAATFTPLGGLSSEFFIESKALGISGNGSVVVGYSDSNPPTGSVREAFYWTRENGMTGLGDLDGGEFLSVANGASFDGSVIVGEARSSTGEEAFRWTSETGMSGFGSRSSANDVSADGAVVVGWKEGLSNYEAFRWTEATGMVGLDTVSGAVQSFAEAVSADGQIVAGRTNTEGFRWTEATGMTGLGDLGGSLPFPVSEAYGISADGLIIVGGARNAVDRDEAFRCNEIGGMEGLGILPIQDFNAAADASADGSIVVGLPGNFTGGEAFIWDENHGLRSLQSVLENDFNLDLTGWVLIAATAISDDGNIIVGFGTNPDGITEGWVVSLADTPVPGTKVTIDIKPGSSKNVINPRSRGGLWVAVLSSNDFDPLQIEIPTVRFGPDKAKVSNHRVKDMNRDGLEDLLLRFLIPQTGIDCADRTASLTGKTFAAQEFSGTDVIKTVGCKSQEQR